MLTMAEIRAKNYNVFDSKIGDDLINRQVSSLKYIEHLGVTTGTDVSSWTPLPLFANSEGHIWKERTKINEVFFTYRDKIKTEVPTPSGLSSLVEKECEALCVNFDKAFSKSIDKLIEREQASLVGIKNNIRSYQNEIDSQNKARFTAVATLAGFNQKKSEGLGISRDLKEVLAEGWWTLSDDPIKESISLLTPEITLTHIRERQAVNTVVNMGRLQVDIAINVKSSSFFVKIVKYDGNPLRGDYYHPHVNSGGDLCTGNMGNDLNKALAEFNLKNTTTIIKDILTNYNVDSPYAQLYKFEEAANEGKIFRREVEIRKAKDIRKAIEENRFTPPLPPQSSPVSPDLVSNSGQLTAEMVLNTVNRDLGRGLMYARSPTHVFNWASVDSPTPPPEPQPAEGFVEDTEDEDPDESEGEF